MPCRAQSRNIAAPDGLTATFTNRQYLYHIFNRFDSSIFCIYIHN
jgi:hypothetical protein